MFYFLLFFTLIVGGICIIFKLIEPRNLFFGASCFVFCLSVTGLMRPYLTTQTVGFFAVVSLLWVPVLLAGVFIVSELANIKQNGLDGTNGLRLGAGLGLIFYLILWPMMSDLTKLTFLNIVYGYITTIVLYFLVLLNLYTITSLLNLIHLRQHPLDYLIVLGAGLAEDQVTPLLATRIERAINLHLQQPHTKLIMSGGQGDDELVAEGVAMAAYARMKGIQSAALLIEDRAVNTFENIAFAYALIDNPSARVGIVSNNYHVMRALMITRELGYSCIGYGAHASWYFSMKAYIREFVAYLYMKRWIHFFGIVMITLIYSIVQGIEVIVHYQSNF